MRLSEVYNSVQGEGPKVGLPTTFVRFGGCNLRCPAWACDSPYAIFPKEYRKEWETIEPLDLFGRINDMTVPGYNVCLTGGEPWLQNHDNLGTLTTLLHSGNRRIECFSNGTIEIPDWAFNRIDFVFDRKLTSSGEDLNKIRRFGGLNGADPFYTNLHRAFVAGRATLKYTIASMDDIDEVLKDFDKLTDRYIAPMHIRLDLRVYIGAVWGKVKESDIAMWLAESDMPNWRLNIQTHKYIFDPEARGI